MSDIGTRRTTRTAASASLNMTRRDSRSSSRTGTVKGTTISFTSTATIADSGNGFGNLAVGDMIEVRGSASNSRRFRLTAAAAGSLTVVPAMVTTIAATPAIEVTRSGAC